MKRLYESLIIDHLANYRQMIFLCDPSQVEKTTLIHQSAQESNSIYLNWDDAEQRALILSGAEHIIEPLRLSVAQAKKPIVCFDELHKYSDWKNFLKGFFDTYHNRVSTIVTGSAQLNTFRHKGDSLMGRYFLYRIHPLSVGELLKKTAPTNLITPPQLLDTDLFDTLYTLGGFPEPFLKGTKQFHTRWQTLRKEQVVKDDLSSFSDIREIDLLEVLMLILEQQSGQLLSYASLARKIQVSDHTIRRWLSALEVLYYSFRIKPWSANITRSLIKEAKTYVWDWSSIKNPGSRLETFVACHLLKAVHFWTDYGDGVFNLYFVRTKDKKEVDFLVTKDRKPWFLVEVKHSYKEKLSKNLLYFHKKLETDYAFQVAYDLPYVEKDCFSFTEPMIVPLQTFLSQLI